MVPDTWSHEEPSRIYCFPATLLTQQALLLLFSLPSTVSIATDLLSWLWLLLLCSPVERKKMFLSSTLCCQGLPDPEAKQLSLLFKTMWQIQCPFQFYLDLGTKHMTDVNLFYCHLPLVFAPSFVWTNLIPLPSDVGSSHGLNSCEYLSASRYPLTSQPSFTGALTKTSSKHWNETSLH